MAEYSLLLNLKKPQPDPQSQRGGEKTRKRNTHTRSPIPKTLKNNSNIGKQRKVPVQEKQHGDEVDSTTPEKDDFLIKGEEPVVVENG